MHGNFAGFMQTSTKKCHRCGFQYPIKNEECSHCSELKTTHELDAFKQQLKQGKKERNNLGLRFLFLMSVIIILLYFSF